MLRKEVWVKDLVPGITVTDMFVVVDLISGSRPEGRKPLRFNLRDRTGAMRAHIWYDDNADRYRELYQIINRAYEEERIVLVEGVVKPPYRGVGENELELRSIEVLEDGDFEEFPTIESLGDEKIGALWEEMLSFINEKLAEAGDNADSRFVRKTLNAFFGDADFARRFRMAPGARYYHHAHLGGLMEHTLNVLRIATDAAILFNRTYENPVLVPLVIAGSALHDVGKMEAYRVSKRDIRETYEGQTMGHIFIGMNMVQTRAQAVFSPEELGRLPALLHVIASHHGSMELGTIVEPLFSEAFIVHYADDLDSKLEHMSRRMDELPAYSAMLKRDLYPPRGWGEE
jgi:3'-5' exoribonuclease